MSEGGRVLRRAGFVSFGLLALVLGAFVTSCDTARPETDRIGVIVTVPPVGDFVSHVAGDRAEVTVMVPPGSSPHTYEPTPSQMAAVSRASIYFKVGSGVEFETMWMADLVETSPEMLVVDCSQGIDVMETDPHIWNSPVNAQVMVESICDGLIEVDPANASLYREHRDDYLTELGVLDSYIRCTFEGFTNRYFLIYHPAFDYFASEYDLTQIAVEHGGKEPTPRVIQDCIDKSLQYDLDYVFVAPQFATDECETIAAEIGGQTAMMDPLPENYIANMARIASALAMEFED